MSLRTPNPTRRSFTFVLIHRSPIIVGVGPFRLQRTAAYWTLIRGDESKWNAFYTLIGRDVLHTHLNAAAERGGSVHVYHPRNESIHVTN